MAACLSCRYLEWVPGEGARCAYWDEPLTMAEAVKPWECWEENSNDVIMDGENWEIKNPES